MSAPRLCPTCKSPLEADTAFCPYDGTPVAHMTQPGRATDPMISMVVDGRYRLLGPIGKGGMASVYRAHSLALGEDVALKVLRSELTRNQRTLVRFARESRAASRIAHQNVVRVLDFGYAGAQGFYFLVMELLEGRTLHELVADEGGLPIPRAVSILSQVAAGLACAHGLGVIHRDLKPGNVMVLPGARVKVVDFGLSRLQSGLDPAVTNAGDLLGTPEYMAPEQWNGGEVDPRTDIYAFGVMAFEMLTARLPFRGSLPEQLHGHLWTAPPDVRAVRPDVPAPLAAMIADCLVKEKQSRLQSFEAILDTLRPLARATPEGGLFAGGGVAADAVTAPDPLSLGGLEDAVVLHHEITRLRRLRERRLRELAAALWGSAPPPDVVGLQRDIVRRESELDARAEALSLADAQLAEAQERDRVGEANLRLSLVEASLRRAGVLEATGDEPTMPGMRAVASLETAEHALAAFRQLQQLELQRLRHAHTGAVRALSALEAELAPLYEALAQKVHAAAAGRSDVRAHVEAFGQLDGALASLQSKLEAISGRA